MSISMDSFTPEQLAKLKSDLAKTMRLHMVNELSQHVHGCDFDQAPVDWQRMIQNMVRKGVKFGL